MPNKRLSTLFYSLGALFLSFDTYQAFITTEYWDVFKNVVFFFILIYMVFIYPKRKLYLTEDMLSLLWIYFSVFTLKSFLQRNWLEMSVGILYTLGFVAYKIYRRKRKYPIYLKR